MMDKKIDLLDYGRTDGILDSDIEYAPENVERCEFLHTCRAIIGGSQ